LGELNYRDMAIAEVAGRLDEFLRLIELAETDEITEKNAEEVVLRAMLDEGLTPGEVVEREGLGTTGKNEIEGAVAAVIEENPGAVADYHAGEEGALNFLIGQVMQATGGSADPGTVNELLRAELD
jgi:aspartyl-tRNA(Asn)/glutamyl-tRNA(Gln) amidotransferase subunit B